MALIVQKYGGTSMGSPERIRNVAKRVARWKAQGHQLVVVVSAMSGETNRLIALAKDVSPQPDARELDVMISTGEQVTIALLAMAIRDLGLKAKSYTGSQVKVLKMLRQHLLQWMLQVFLFRIWTALPIKPAPFTMN